MKWKDVLEKIERMTEDQLSCDVAIHLESRDEFFGVDHMELVNKEDEDRLDDGHPIMVVFDNDGQGLNP